MRLYKKILFCGCFQTCTNDKSSSGCGRRVGSGLVSSSVDTAESPATAEGVGADGEEQLLETLETTIWVCLQCGHQVTRLSISGLIVFCFGC